MGGGELTVEAVVDGKKTDDAGEEQSEEKSNPEEGGDGGDIDGGAEQEEGGGEAQLGEEFGGADFLVAVAAFTAEEEPGDDGEIVVPVERVIAMQTDRAGAELLLVGELAVEPAGLAAEEGAETGADESKKDEKPDLHIIILA